MLAIVSDTDRAYGHILPDDCKERETDGKGYIALIMLDKYLASRGVDLDSPEAVRMRIEISRDPEWRIPRELHDKLCKCQKKKEPRNLKEALASADALIDEWGLPCKGSSASKSGVAYYAEASGTKKNPIIYLRFYRNGKRAIASYSLTEARWCLYAGERSTCVGKEVSDVDAAINAAIEIVKNI